MLLPCPSVPYTYHVSTVYTEQVADSAEPRLVTSGLGPLVSCEITNITD